MHHSFIQRLLISGAGCINSARVQHVQREEDGQIEEEEELLQQTETSSSAGSAQVQVDEVALCPSD